MKLYKEMMRRYLVVGVIVFVLTVVISCAMGFMKAQEDLIELTEAINLMPFLPVFDYAAGLLFGLIGFSFLNKRASSDFYHSIPASRAKLFLSVTLAALTWISVTVIAAVLLTASAYLIMGMPFVGLYVPMNILFHIVAAMLVFAAAAVGCSLTGTFLTNAIVTGLVLFLPRFLLFIFARQLIDKGGMMTWNDLSWLLAPTTNIATGMIVMLSRMTLIGSIVSMPHILYSLGLAVAELFGGCVLFVHRPSELAEHCAENRGTQTVFSCMAALPFLALIPIVSADFRHFFNWGTAIIVLMSFVLFVIYQLIALRSRKRTYPTLPFFLCSVACVVLMMGCVELDVNTVLGPRGMPIADESLNPNSFGAPKGGAMKWVTFGGDDWPSDGSYQSLLIRRIRFDDMDVKKRVAQELETSVYAQRAYGGTYGNYDPYEVNFETSRGIGSVTIRKTNGATIRRTISIRDLDSLNRARCGNPEFREAILAFPPVESIKIVSNPIGLTEEDTEKLRACYFAECREKGVIPNREYDCSRFAPINYTDWRNDYLCGEDQQYGSFSVAGNIGTKRYFDNYFIDARTPKTASLLMMLRNHQLPQNNAESMARAYRLVSASTGGNDNFNASLTFYNAKLFGDDWDAGQAYFYIYNVSYANADSAPKDEYYCRMQEYASKLVEIMRRGTPTNDATRFHVGFTWNASTDTTYTGSYTINESGERFEQMQYLGFSEQDEAELLRLTKDWMQVMHGTWEIAG